MGSVLGTNVELVVNDPWDFTAKDGSVRFSATIVGVSAYELGDELERFLVRLGDPARWHGELIEHLVASHRQGHGLVDELRLGQPIECNLIAIPPERARGNDPLDTAWWRGGLAARATLSICT